MLYCASSIIGCVRALLDVVVVVTGPPLSSQSLISSSEKSELESESLANGTTVGTLTPRGREFFQKFFRIYAVHRNSRK